jgi:hypothetical protein
MSNHRLETGFKLKKYWNRSRYWLLFLNIVIIIACLRLNTWIGLILLFGLIDITIRCYWVPVIEAYEFSADGVYVHQASYRKIPPTKKLCLLQEIERLYVKDNEDDSLFDLVVEYNNKQFSVSYDYDDAAFEAKKSILDFMASKGYFP